MRQSAKAYQKIRYGEWRILKRTHKGINKAAATRDVEGKNGKTRRQRIILDGVTIESPLDELRAALIAKVEQMRMSEIRGTLTMQFVFEEWVSNKEAEGQSSAKLARSRWKQLAPFFARLHPLEISDRLCRDYAEYRFEGGTSRQTIWTDMVDLQAMVNYAKKQRWISDEVFIWKPSKGKGAQVVATTDELARLLNAVNMDGGAHVLTALMLIMFTGVRAGAAFELQWDQIDWQSREINFDAGQVDDLSKHILHKGYQKGRPTVAIGPYLYEYLLDEKRRTNSKFVVNFQGLKVGSIKTSYNKVRERANAKRVTLKVMRHTVATLARDAGFEPKLIGQQLGHAPGSQVAEQVYIHRDSAVPLRPIAQLIEEKIVA